MNKLFVGVFEGISREEQLNIAKEIGYDGFFTGPEFVCDHAELRAFRAQGDELGLSYETIHSSLKGCSDIWFEGKEGDDYINVLLSEIDICVTLDVPILIVHVQTDFRKDTNFELGAKRYESVVAKAKENGIKIAFENADDEDYIYRMLDYFDEPHVGFCYDSGHESSVTRGAHFLPRLGKRLICTHLHDNDSTSDQHKLPFDGVIDFAQVVKDLKAIGYRGNLTFELRYSDEYANKYSKREFLEECYTRALKLRDMLNE